MSCIVEMTGIWKSFPLKRERYGFKEFMVNLPHLAGKQVPCFWALKDLNLKVERGECLGIVGRNGGGKSTLLSMLLGSVYPTKGRVSVSENVTPLLELGSGFHPDLTGRENIFLNGVLLGLPIAEVEVHLEKIVAFAEIGDFLDMPLRTYSSGMQFRLAFSIAVNSQPRLLLIDEVLAVGDEAFQMKCKHAINWFLEHGVTIILVSHDMVAVKDICSRAIWLDRGEIKKDGKPEMVVEEYLSHL